MARSLDVMLHVTDEQGLVGEEPVLAQNLMNHLTLVPDADVRLVEVSGQARRGLLHVKVILLHRAEEERSDLARPTELEEFLGMRQADDQILNLTQSSVKPLLQLRHGDMGNESIVEAGKGKAKFRPQLLKSQFRNPRLMEDMVGRLPNRRQII